MFSSSFKNSIVAVLSPSFFLHICLEIILTKFGITITNICHRGGIFLLEDAIQKSRVTEDQ